MRLQVASTNKLNGLKVSNFSTSPCIFYSIVVDPSMQSTDFSYYFYVVGYCYTPNQRSTNGIVLSRGKVTLAGDLTISWKLTDVTVLDEGCYDIWTETLKPQIHLQKEGADQMLYVSIPGKCNSIYKYLLNSDNFFPS